MDTILARDMVRDYTSEYAMYVATSRSIVSLIDGLKPVWRRCINSADDLKLYHNRKHLKVSKLTGQVLGDYHPHGGANPVLLAQPFRFRYPLFEGQGNYGSPDMPDSYAAARYLEIRLSKFCEDFYLESADYADREDNYDGRLKEITQYYPALPGCLFTGASGIAVGFSTEIPPHTITDIGNSLLAYIKNPSSAKYLKGLYPETCEKSVVLTPLPDIQKIYETGEGSVKYKASTHYETIGGKFALVVDSFPPGFSKKRLDTPSIMDAVDKGLLEVSNESAENIRYVFTSSDRKILENLEDRLTSSVGYRMYIEHRGVIRLYKLKEIYDTFISEKSNFIIRKYKSLASDLEKEDNYLSALIALKEDKEYLRDMFDKTSDEVLEELILMYNISNDIAKRILSTSLRSLMSDNIQELQKKKEEIVKTIEEYQVYINDPLFKIVKDIKSLMKSYKNETKNATHISLDTEELFLEVVDKDGLLTYKFLKNATYFLGTPDNKIRKVFGADLTSKDITANYIQSSEFPYYFLYDDKGCCTVPREILETSGSKLNSDNLKGIIGLNDLSEISIKQGNGRVYPDVKWSLRKKTSYIRLSKDNEPPFEIIQNSIH